VLTDTFGRPLGSLRLSLTDRCNLRCRYCMPEEEYVWLPRASILSFEEIARLVGIFGGLGTTKVRLTGGEPLLRRDVPALVALLATGGGGGVADLALTTNGLMLAGQAAALQRAGLHRVTVSLDTLRADRFESYTRSRRHNDVLAGIVAAREAGFRTLKLNTVVVRGYNDDELADLIEFGRAHDAEVRFIEYMDVGGATRWTMDQVVPRSEMLERLARRYGPAAPLREPGPVAAPAERFALPDGTAFGIISSTTAPFCRACDRSRITADGTWYRCLYAARGLSLRDPLREGASDAEIAALIGSTWRARADRGAEERLAVSGRGALYAVEGLRADPHREMHTRGG
jgi:cyclic pyranopterin phosphate synthase